MLIRNMSNVFLMSQNDNDYNDDGVGGCLNYHNFF